MQGRNEREAKASQCALKKGSMTEFKVTERKATKLTTNTLGDTKHV